MYNHPEFATKQSFFDRMDALPLHVVYGQLMGRPSWGEAMAKYVPGHMQQGFLYYIAFGIGMGSFGRALLSNDLMGAFGKADEANLAAMKDWTMFLYNYAPRGCFGSPENYESWKGVLNAEEE